MRTIFRLWMVPVSIWACALSALTWSINGRVDDEGRWEPGLRHLFGWSAADMEEEWQHLRKEPWSRKYHWTKNLLHEWIKRYPKRAAKIGSLYHLVSKYFWFGIGAGLVWIF